MRDLLTRYLWLPLSVTMTLPLLGAGWKLVWSDEFDAKGLPDPSKWIHEVGFVRNQELQYYTKDRLENVRQENGLLVIEGRKEKFPNPGFVAGTDAADTHRGREFADYTAGSINTFTKQSFLYGRIEMRAKIPHGQGMWPAFWMLGTNHNTVGWPKCGEIDIMEFVGKDPDHIHATVHYWKDGKHGSQGGKLQTPAPYDAFHLYAVEWFPDRMDFYFDQMKYFTFPLDTLGTGSDNPFRKPHFILLNLAMGGSWGGRIDDSMLPQPYLIDYVRAYQNEASGTR